MFNVSRVSVLNDPLAFEEERGGERDGGADDQRAEEDDAERPHGPHQPPSRHPSVLLVECQHRAVHYNSDGVVQHALAEGSLRLALD